MLHPIFEEASNVIKEEYPNANQVVFARVDCDQHCKYLIRSLEETVLSPSLSLMKSNLDHLTYSFSAFDFQGVFFPPCFSD